ncbi:MAG: DUF3333 domain-containing protein, partial [Alphaproteobacteria bacterium]|nr:DUF3333 domain-containing protein [Alphaproteobacteria bacterium]
MNNPDPTASLHLPPAAEALLARRHSAERRFRQFGAGAIIAAFVVLVVLLASVIGKGYTALWQTEITLPVTFSASILDPKGLHDPQALVIADYTLLARQSLKKAFPAVKERQESRELYGLLSTGVSHQLRRMVKADQSLIGRTVEVSMLASDEVDMFLKGRISADVPESARKFSDRQIAWLKALEEHGAVEQRFNSGFFTSGDSREPEQAGMLGSIVGSLFTILVCLAVSFPFAVLTAVYLEEFSTPGRLSDIIEVNINNLAAVPSIIFGLLGLSVYLGFFGLPRSSALVGGLTLALMTLPTIIITTRTALKSIPGSIRDAARALGASPMQVVMHHTLPLALPGIMTG